MRVLVVEDEEFLREMIAEGLRGDALAVDEAGDGLEALHRLRLGEYDVLVLDRDLPGLHGDEVCRQVVRERLLTRVLMLTASGSVRDRVEGLGLGADDYLTKPFAYDELLARVLALGGAPIPRCLPSWSARASPWTPPGGPPPATVTGWRCPARSSRCWRRCCGPRERSSAATT